MTAVQTIAVDTTYREPRAGDVVHYWPADPPPLSSEYVKPACRQALIVRVHSALGAPDKDGVAYAYAASADLVVVTDRGVEFLYDVPRMESYAAMHGQRSYGVPASWHFINHPEETP